MDKYFSYEICLILYNAGYSPSNNKHKYSVEGTHELFEDNIFNSVFKGIPAVPLSDKFACNYLFAYSVIKDCIGVLQSYLPPDGIYANEAISRLLGILDNKEMYNFLKSNEPLNAYKYERDFVVRRFLYRN